MQLTENAQISPQELVQLARATMEEAKFPFLASIDGEQARLRPVSPVRVDHFTVYVANLRRYHKTLEIASKPKVELCYMAPSHHQVRITGDAEILIDQVTMKAIWESNPLLQKFVGNIENPQLIIYRIRPTRVRFMKEWALEYHEVPLPEP
jgi:general stress protein 26